MSREVDLEEDELTDEAEVEVDEVPEGEVELELEPVS